MLTVGGQMFIEYEIEIDNSNQIIRGYENYIVDINFENDISDKVSGDNINENAWSEKDVIYKKFTINRFLKL